MKKIVQMFMQITLLIILGGGTANAVLLTMDWQSVGDGLMIHDTNSSLNWLRLTETNGLGYDYVSTQFGVGGQFEGLRYATDDEVFSLLANFSIYEQTTEPYITVAGLDSRVVDLSSTMGNLFGEEDPVNTPYGAVGITAESNAPGRHNILGAYYEGDIWNVSTIVNNGSGVSSTIDGLTTFTHTGSFLVQVIPLPPAVLLLGSGLMGLLAFSRRRAGR